MTDRKKLFSTYRADLDQKEQELIARKRAMNEFLKGNHKVKETKKHLESLNALESDIDDMLLSLIALKSSSKAENEAEKLCIRYRGLNEKYVRHIEKLLSDDLARHQHDLIRNAGVFAAIVAGSITAVTKGVGNNTISTNEAAGAGGAVGLLVIFHKKVEAGFRSLAKALCKTPKQLKTGFRAVGKAICESPRGIRDSFSLFYLRETIKEKAQATQKALHMRNPEP